MFEQGFSFEQWVVTPADSVVSGPYGETRLEPRVMDVLVHLATHAGEVVTRIDLIDTVWGGAIVGDDVLSRSIYQARQALGESSRKPRFIQTIPKRGYRLNAAVTDLSETEQAIRKESWRQGSPFRGLQAFDVEHAAVFFGRTRATFEALTALRQQASLSKPFLLLLGSSGIGKSSLARAGILHNLIHSSRVPEISTWHYEVFRPGDSAQGPVRALFEAVNRALASAGKSPVAEADFAAADSDAVAGVFETQFGNDERLLLVIDQLEGIFSGWHSNDEQRRRFFELLEAFVSSGRCWIIATLRSDFYAQSVGFPALMRLKKGGGQYDVRPMGPGEIRQAIRLPALAAGLNFERDLESGQALDEVLYEAAATTPSLLPLLEFTLQALYDERSPQGVLTFAAYRALGGIEGSLARRASTVFDQLPEPQQATLPQVMARLVRIRKGRVAVASSALGDFPGEDARKLVQAFVDARLFSVGMDTGIEPGVTITHEALLTHWPRISEWVAENHEMIHVRQRVAGACERWKADAQRDDLLLPRGKALDEAAMLLTATGIDLNDSERAFIDASKRRASRRRLIERAAVAVLVILTIAAGGFAWQAGLQRELAEEQTRIADREALAARESSDFLIGIFESADPSESTGGQLTAKRVLDEGIARLDAGLVRQEALRTRLRILVARAYKGLGLYSDAEALLRQAADEATRRDEISDRERLEIKFQLADTLFQRGDIAAAEPLHADVLSGRRALFGEHDLDTLASLAVHAHELWRNGAVGEAEELFKQVLSMRQEKLGERHRHVTDILSSLGTLYYLQDLFVEAEGYYRAAAEQAAETYGERHIGTAIALSNLSLVETDPAEREALLNRSLSIRQEVLGRGHVLVARAEESLAWFYSEQGDRERAESLYRQSLQTLAGIDEPTPVLAWVQNRYAQFLESGERYDEAIAKYSEARDNFAELSGASHRWTLNVHGNLGYAHYLAGDAQTARKVLDDALQIAHANDSASNVMVADLQRLQAEVILAQGDAATAIRVAEDSASVYESDIDLHRRSLALVLETLAAAQLEAGDADQALQTATRGLALGKGGHAGNGASLTALAGLAMAAIGNCAEALSLLDTAEAVEPPGLSIQKAWVATRIERGRALCGR